MPRTRSRLYRRKDSPFFWAEFTTAQGGVVRQSTGCRDHGAATAWLATRELERVKGEAGLPVARPVSLLQATAEYLVQKKASWSDGWYVTVTGFVTHQVIPHFGAARQAHAVTRADVETFRALQMVRPRHRGGGTVSGATVNRLMAAMAAFGEWCQVKGRGYHVENPWAKHEALPEDELPVPDVEEAQIEQILATLDDRTRFKVAWRPLVEFALETGLRKSELSRLRWEHVRLEDRIAFLASTRKHGRTKSRKMRPVPLSQRARAVLEALARREDGLVFGKVPDPRRAFATAAKAAGLERVWMHLFRHLAASRFAESGAGGHELQAFGGWSSLRMAQRYSHAQHKRMLDLLDRREKANGPRTEPDPGKTTGGQLSPTAREPD